jgi:hypothetical protein
MRHPGVNRGVASGRRRDNSAHLGYLRDRLREDRIGRDRELGGEEREALNGHEKVRQTMRKSCAPCGAEIPEGAAICDNCGMPVSEAASRAPPRKAPAQAPPTLHEESASEHRLQLGQVEPSPSESQARGGVAGDGSRRRGGCPGFWWPDSSWWWRSWG